MTKELSSSSDEGGGEGEDNNEEKEDDADPSFDFVKVRENKWTYAFGGDFGVSRIEQQKPVRAKGKGKSSKSLHPIELLAGIDGDLFSTSSSSSSSSVSSRSPSRSPQWITVAAETAADSQRWLVALTKSRDILQYFRACRDCSNAPPLSSIIVACSTGDWKVIKFRNLLLTSSSVAALAVFFKRRADYAPESLAGVSELIVSGCGFDDSSCELLLNVLDTTPRLQKIRLPNNEITDVGVRYLAASPAFRSSLIELDLSHNRLNSQSAQRLAVPLAAAPFLKKLDVSNNDIKLDGAAPLLKAVLESRCPLEVLALSGNELGDVGGVLTAQVIAGARDTLRVLRVAQCKLERRGIEAIVEALENCNKIQQVRMHGNVARADAVGNAVRLASSHHCHKPGSQLNFSIGGIEGSPSEAPLHAAAIKNHLASMERSTHATNLRLRRRGLHIIRAEHPPRRVLIWLNLTTSDEVEVSMFRARLAKFLGIRPVHVHIASTLKESPEVMRIVVELCAPPATVKLLSTLAVTNDPKLRSIGVMRVAEPVHEVAMNGADLNGSSSGGSAPGGLGASSEFERFIQVSAASQGEEKKSDGTSSSSSAAVSVADEFVKNSVHPLVATVDLPSLLPKHTKELAYRRPRSDSPPASLTTPPPPPPLSPRSQQKKISFSPELSSPAPSLPSSPAHSAAPTPAPATTTKVGFASMSNAYSLAADFFGDQANHLDLVSHHITEASASAPDLSPTPTNFEVAFSSLDISPPPPSPSSPSFAPNSSRRRDSTGTDFLDERYCDVIFPPPSPTTTNTTTSSPSPGSELPQFLAKHRELCRAIHTRQIPAISAAIASVKEDSMHSGSKWQEVKQEGKKSHYQNRTTGKTQFEKPAAVEDPDVEQAQKFLSKLIMVQQSFATLRISTDDFSLLEQYQAYLVRCAVLGYSGTEALLAYQQMQEHIMKLITERKIDANSWEYGMTQLKGQLVYTMLARPANFAQIVSQQLDTMKKARANLGIAETSEEYIANILIQHTKKLDATVEKAMDADKLKVVESVILQSYVLGHHTDRIEQLKEKLARMGAQASVVLAAIFEAAKKMNISELKKGLAEAKKIGLHAPGLQEAENLIEQQSRLNSEKTAKEAIARAARVIRSGTLSTSNTAELIPVVRLLESLDLSGDSNTKSNFREVQKYIAKLSEKECDLESELLLLLSKGDKMSLQKFLDGKGDDEMVVAAPSPQEMQSWIEACNTAGIDEGDSATDTETTCVPNTSLAVGGEAGKAKDDAVSSGVVWKRGMLMKMGRNKKGGVGGQSWKERYCVLQGNTLTYYLVSSDKKTKTKKGGLLVSEAASGESAATGLSSAAATNMSGKPNTFRIREGRDLSSIDSMLMHEAKRQLRVLQKEDMEKVILEAIDASSTGVLRTCLAQVDKLGLDVNDDLLEESKTMLNQEDRAAAKAELQKSVDKCSRGLITENLATCEKLGVEEDADVMIRARDMIRHTETELALQRMRFCLKSANTTAFEADFMGIRSSANATDEDKEALASLVMQNALRLMRSKLMDGSNLDEEARGVRQAISACRNFRVEISPMQLAKLSLNDVGIDGGVGGVASKGLGGIFMGGTSGGGDGVYSLNKCPLLKEDVSQEVQPPGSGLFKKVARMSMMAASSGKSNGLLLNPRNLRKGGARGSCGSSAKATALFSEGRLRITKCLTKGIASSPGGELKGLEMFFYLKSIALEGNSAAAGGEFFGGSEDAVAQNAMASAVQMAKGEHYAPMATKIVLAARKDGAVANEVYMQLCKLMTDHETKAGGGGDEDMGAGGARLRCWYLMAFLLRSVVVNSDLLPFLDHHLHTLKQYETQQGTGLASKMLATNRQKSAKDEASLDEASADNSGSSRSIGSSGGGTVRGMTTTSDDAADGPMLMKVSKYCHRYLTLQANLNGQMDDLADACREPKLTVAECLFEEKKIRVSVFLMTGNTVEVPVPLMSVNSVFPFLAIMEMSLRQTTWDVKSEKLKTELVKRWNGFSLYAVNGTENSSSAKFGVRNLPLIPSEDERIAVDTDVCWLATYAEFLSGKKVLVLRQRSNNRSETYEDDFTPRVLNSEVYHKDVLVAKRLWQKWIASGVGVGGLVRGGVPSDSLKIDLIVVEEVKRFQSRMYDAHQNSADAAAGYLLGLQFAQQCPRDEWPKGTAGLGFRGWLQREAKGRPYAGNVAEETVRGLLDLNCGSAHDNAHFSYLLKRAWLAYARMWPLFGSTRFTGNLKQNNKVAVSQDVELFVNSDGVMVFSKQTGGLMFKCRHAEVDECFCSTKEGPQHLTLSFTNLNLDFEVYEVNGGKNFCSLVGGICGDLLWEGSFEHGSGLGSAESKTGSLSQHEMMANFLHDFPVLPTPPDPPVIEVDSRFFDVPESDRKKWVELAKEAETRSVEEARELSEKAAAREQDAMEKATKSMMNIAEDDDEDGGDCEGEGEGGGGGHYAEVAKVKSAKQAQSQKKHNLNSTIFGVSGNPPSMNFAIPDPPASRRRFGVVHNHSRICGGVLSSRPPVRPDRTKIGLPKEVLPKFDLAFPSMSPREEEKVRTKMQIESRKSRGVPEEEEEEEEGEKEEVEEEEEGGEEEEEEKEEEKQVEEEEEEEIKTEAQTAHTERSADPPPPGLQALTPVAPPPPPQAASVLENCGRADLWVCRCDPGSGRAFYVEGGSGESAWTQPEGSSEVDVAAFARQYQEDYRRIAAAEGQRQQRQPLQQPVEPLQQPAEEGGTARQQTAWNEMTPEQRTYYTWYYKHQAEKGEEEEEEEEEEADEAEKEEEEKEEEKQEEEEEEEKEEGVKKEARTAHTERSAAPPPGLQAGALVAPPPPLASPQLRRSTPPRKKERSGDRRLGTV